jgi:UDP-2,3-diacylglucosamine pyrophosphatase LpxH
MANRYFVVSDLHLADVEDHIDGWKAYKHSHFTFDQALDEQVMRFLSESAPGDSCTLVLNGDIFDFDLVTRVPEKPPWPVSPIERMHGLEPIEEKSAWKMWRLLADHPIFVGTLARVIGAGHRVVHVVGNHDPEVNFRGVRQVLVDLVRARAESEGLDFAEERLSFEPWFFYVPGEIYAEHGHQYDVYNTFRFPLAPFVTSDGPPKVALSMGNTSNRYLASKMGFFNPNASDYILNVYEYVLHWYRFYAFRGRSLVWSWLVGSIRVLVHTLRTKRQVLAKPPDYEALLEGQAHRNNLSLETIKRLDRLRRQPIADRVYRMVREFWIDRLVIAAGMTWGTIVLWLLAIPLWIKIMVPLSTFPLIYLIYEWFAHGETVFSVERVAQRLAGEVSAILPVRVVTFGHTHVPEIIPLRPGVSYVNTGTWAPWFEKSNVAWPKTLRTGLRNILAVSVDGDRVETRLDSCI